MINFLGKKNDINLSVISTSGVKSSSLLIYKNSSVKIIRTPGIVPGSVFRIINYLKFYIGSLWLLIKTRPQVILYYETLSSWPAIIYKKIRKDKVKLFLHCHEYTVPEHYKNMRLNEFMHNMEKNMYAHKFEWISHTNEVRLAQFIKDNNLNNVDNKIFHCLPNYPSLSWNKHKNDFGSTNKTRLVFVGSLGYDNMYLKETIDWVLDNKDYLSLDIYAYNIDKKALAFLKEKEGSYLNYYGGINYMDLPNTLKQYDVGLVMYKPFSYNTVIAVSNKVFEYLACGLDVWFSEDMTYTLKYSRTDVFPKIIPLNFKKLREFNFQEAVNRKGLAQANTQYFYEEVYEDLYTTLVNLV